MRYQFIHPGFKSHFNANTPDAIKFILFVNLAIFIITELFGFKYLLFQIFGLVPQLTFTSLKLWQPLTYFFLHSGFFHILINMLVLWMFGRELEYRWGKNKFLLYYFITGIGSGIVTILFNPHSLIPIVGASGSIYGILTAYTLIHPNRRVFIYGIFPVQIKYMMIFLALTALFASLTQVNSTISHLTHLSGMLIGFLYLKWKNLFKIIPKIKIHDTTSHIIEKKKNKDEIDIILDKLKISGWDGLSDTEKTQLFDASKYYSKDQPPN